MAATTELRERIDLDLRIVRAAIEFLPELERGWNQEDGVNQRMWHREWWDAMCRLRALHHDYVNGNMTTDQVASYESLFQSFRETSPVIERLGLEPLSVTLEHFA